MRERGLKLLVSGLWLRVLEALSYECLTRGLKLLVYAAPRKLCRQDLLGAATELQQSCNSCPDKLKGDEPGLHRACPDKLKGDEARHL